MAQYFWMKPGISVSNPPTPRPVIGLPWYQPFDQPAPKKYFRGDDRLTTYVVPPAQPVPIAGMAWKAPSEFPAKKQSWLFYDTGKPWLTGPPVDPWSPYDGLPNASIGTPPLSTLLNAYGANRPAWRVAGSDYGVGQNAGITVFGSTSTNPTQAQINLASTGATISGSTVTLAGANPSLGSASIGFTFAANTIIVISSSATGTITIQNVVVTMSGQGGKGITVPNGTVANCTIKYCEVNGSKYAGSATQLTDTAIYYGGTGAFICNYCYLHGLPIDAIQVQSGTATFDIRWNAFNGIGYSTAGTGGGHPDILQLLGGSVSGFVAHNLIYNPNDGAGQSGDNPLLDVEAQTSGSPHNIIFANNTLISAGTTSAPTNSLTTGSFIDDTTSTLNGFSFIYNWIDQSGVKFSPPYYGTASQLQVTTGSINLWEGNRLLTTGALSNPTSVGYVPAGSTTATAGSPLTNDAVSTAASPSTGTETNGSTIVITITAARSLTLGSTPQLLLNNGAVASYTSGSGTSSLTFSYTVAGTDTATSNLAVTGFSGSAIDIFGNAANLSGANVTFTGLAIAPTVSAFPGQTGNLVGFANTPANILDPISGIQYSNTAYPGSLTVSSSVPASGTAGNPTVVAFKDFVAAGTTSGALPALTSSNNWITFIGCRFQSNDRSNYNMQLNGATNITFLYCSVVPLASLYTAPPGAAWPSASAGLQTTTQVTDTNCINGNSGYQYGLNIISGGPCTALWCDFWGFGNGGPLFYSTTAPMTVQDCWIHDCCNESPQGYHQDGTGYVNGAVQPSNILIKHCTIASLGNTQGIAFQGGSTPLSFVTIDSCYLSGFSFLVALDETTASTKNNNITFTNNIFATDLPWAFGPIYTSSGTNFSTGVNNTWSGNKLKVAPGTSPIAGSNFPYTSANDGQFVWPDSTLHTVDF